MSKCRCNDIRECKEDLTMIGNAEPYISTIKGINCDVNSMLEGVAAGCTESFETSYMVEICAAINNLAQPFITSIEQFSSDMNSAKTEVKNKKENFKREDDAHHAEELAARNNVSKIGGGAIKQGIKAL